MIGAFQWLRILRIVCGSNYGYSQGAPWIFEMNTDLQNRFSGRIRLTRLARRVLHQSPIANRLYGSNQKQWTTPGSRGCPKSVRGWRSRKRRRRRRWKCEKRGHFSDANESSANGCVSTSCIWRYVANAKLLKYNPSFGLIIFSPYFVNRSQVVETVLHLE